MKRARSRFPAVAVLLLLTPLAAAAQPATKIPRLGYLFFGTSGSDGPCASFSMNNYRDSLRKNSLAMMFARPSSKAGLDSGTGI